MIAQGRAGEQLGRNARKTTVTDATIDVAAFLEEHRNSILAAADEQIARAHLAHYEAAGREETDLRLRELLEVVIAASRTHQLDGASHYADALAEDRHQHGYALSEVQTAINVLEEAVWRSVTADAPAEAQGYALGLVSTVLGAIKDRLACAYVAQVSSHTMATLRLDYLFRGTEGTAPHGG